MRVRGSIRVPGDKSISHRALVFAALASGRSRTEGVLQSADVLSTAAVLRALGADVPALSPSLEIVGRGLRSLRAPTRDLDCGNSGTTTRLVAGMAAACPFRSRFVGDASLSRRPMQRVSRPLSAMGAHFSFERGDGLPMEVEGGRLRSIEWQTEAASAQIKSAILLAAVVAGVPVTVREPARSRDHTETMLRAAGAAVTTTDGEVRLDDPPDALQPLRVAVPGDPSSAAFFVALAALADGGELVLPAVGLNESRTGFLHAMRRMGAQIDVEEGTPQAGERVGTLRVRPSSLAAIEVTELDVPAMIDELPLLACVAARAVGETVIRGAGELRVKESDRIAAVVSSLRAIGAESEELPDGLRVRGSSRPLRGPVRTHGDHRIAMAFGVLGALDGNDITVDDVECVRVSYPSFWEDLERATPA